MLTTNTLFDAQCRTRALMERDGDMVLGWIILDTEYQAASSASLKHVDSRAIRLATGPVVQPKKLPT
jgi:hypothetical protein